MKRNTAKVFTTGRSQAVRLPKEFRFEGNEVYVSKEGESVILSPRPSSWGDFFTSDLRPTDDFMRKRADLAPQKREAI